MSEYSRFIRWSAGCRNHISSGGQTAGDTAYLGLTNYDEPFPCPNGLGIDARPPNDVPEWRARVAKAKRDIDWHRREFIAADLVFSEDDVFDLITIAKGFDE